MTKKQITDLLDVLGVLVISVGAGFATYQWIGWACVLVTGVALVGFSQVIEWIDNRRRE